ncbi:MAG: hypothetical protein J5379_11220 [Clostridiales bacterium]|nr:hypothetical protein [Clostridiales bacterium]
MVIETKSSNDKATAKECTNIMIQGNDLLKNPEKKLRDFFRFVPISSAFVLVVLVLCIVWILLGSASTLTYVCLGLIGAALVVEFVFVRTMMRLYKTFVTMERTVTLSFDEEGIDFDDHTEKKMKLLWSGTAFVRFFPHVVAIFPKTATGIMILISAEHADEVRGFLKEKNIGIKVVE